MVLLRLQFTFVNPDGLDLLTSLNAGRGFLRCPLRSCRSQCDPMSRMMQNKAPFASRFLTLVARESSGQLDLKAGGSKEINAPYRSSLEHSGKFD